MVFLTFFGLAFSALLPLINPLGSARSARRHAGVGVAPYRQPVADCRVPIRRLSATWPRSSR